MTALFALAGAMIIGTVDFGGGYASRTNPPVRVAAWIQASSVLITVAALTVIETVDVTSTDVIAGAVAGLSGTFSFIALYTAFQMGQISLLAPIAAILGAVIPTVVGTFRGEPLRAVNIVGIVGGLVAIGLVSREARQAGEPRAPPPFAFALAFVAGGGFSIFFLALAETSEDAGLWPLLIARFVSIPLVIAVSVLATGGITIAAASRRVVIAAGFGEAIANIFALWSYQRGPLAVAAVLGALFPVSTVLLARVVFREHLGRVQWTGVGVALASVPLVAWPT